ncbi:MAG: hypothetical protein PHX87_00375 [Candidatus Peribacteraceae bacterium]|nr:hypothetical protein [Candidatus Peribacteraceae bacterium]MDD5741863.1 hypothetical protein [Candidatus Peribacteraceae bacterium]
MKRTSLLFIGLLAFSVASPATAAGDQYADLKPVSPYIERVVRRVRKGLDSAGGGDTTSDKVLKLFWLDQITGVILLNVDTDLRIVEQQKDLIENSPCLRLDTLIIEGWMERARIRKNDAIDAGRISEAVKLISMQRYLNNRYKALLLGVRDPTYVDEEEGSLYGFDPPSFWCCPGEPEAGNDKRTCQQVDEDGSVECERNRGMTFKRRYACIQAGCTSTESGGEDEEEPCPFSSDYLPPTGVGYGCDLSILNDRMNGPEGITKEIEGLQKLVQDRDAAITDIATVKDTIVNLERRLGGGTMDLSNFGAGASGKRTHKVKNGCLAEGETLPKGVAYWERRGPFSFSTNEIVLMPKLSILWNAWGRDRLPPPYLRNANQLPEGTPERKAADQMENGMLFWLLGTRSDVQQYLQKFSLNQAKEESTQIAKTIDAPLRVLETLAPLRKEVRGLALTVQSSDKGVRKFVRDFAAFLRTSCIFRPCNEQLDRILKIIFKDECFPYINGAALDEDVATKCKNAAGL